MKVSEVTQSVTDKAPEVYLDMDGVLADFISSYNQLAGTSYTSQNQLPDSQSDPVFKQIAGTDFFSRLGKYPSADELVSLVVDKFGHYNICSSPLRSDYENSAKNKRAWLDKNLLIKPTTVIITSKKEEHAVQADGTPNILIDDRPRVINPWRAAGGIGILYDAGKDTVDSVRTELEKITVIK